MLTVSGAEFNQRPSHVKREAERGPVVITDHGRPSFVLMTHAEYARLQRVPDDLAGWLEMGSDGDEFDFDIEPAGIDIDPADL